MLTLSRRVRFAVNPGSGVGPSFGTPENLDRSDRAPLPAANGFGGSPAMRGFGRHYEIEAVCCGEPDAVTGYFINIKDIDRAVRAQAVPIVERVCAESPGTNPAVVVGDLFRACDEALGGRVRDLRLHLSPTYSVGIEERAMNRAVIRQQFDFAAAHRLHVPTMSDDDNRRTFGRCNNPSGHGHNYRIEAAVEIPTDGVRRFGLEELESAAMDAVVDYFDHKHLNVDTREFLSGSGVNPSVENIARVCFERLAPEIEKRSAGTARLRAVTVWETDRTSCTYPA